MVGGGGGLGGWGLKNWLLLLLYYCNESFCDNKNIILV